MNKRGISEVVTTVLIILLVLAAIVIIWVFVRSAVQSGAGKVEAGLFTSVLEIKSKSVGVDSNLNITSFVIQRKAGKGEVVGYNVILKDVNGDTCVQEFKPSNGIKELETQRVDALYNTDDCKVRDLAEISVAPIVLNIDGLELIGEITDTYKIKGLEGLPDNEPEPVIECTLDAECVDFNFNTEDKCISNRCQNINALVGYWDFNEGAGTLADDSSGNNNDGTVSGNPQWQTCTQAGKSALLFDGAGDYVNVPDNSALDNSGDYWTVSAWIKTSSTDTQDMIVAKRDDSPGSGGYNLGLINGIQLNGRFENSISDFVEVNSLGDAVNDKSWHHVVMVRTVDDLGLYIDGLPDGTGTASSVLGSVANSVNLRIGASASMSSPLYFNGVIDEVKIWNRALSASDVAELYADGGNCEIESGVFPTSGLAGYWAFNENSGSTTADSSANGNNGTCFIPSSTNLALNKPTSQSSTYLNELRYSASNAVDNELTTFQHTYNNQGEWLKVDLGTTYTLTRFELVKRQDCCSNRPNTYQIQVSSTGGLGGFSGEQTTVINQTTASCSTSNCVMQHAINPINGRYVRVLNKGSGDDAYMNIAEFRIFSDTGSCNFVSGKSGNAISFKGIDKNYVNAGNSEVLSLTSDFTLSAWINKKSNSAIIISKRPDADNYNYVFNVNSIGNLNLYWSNPSGTLRSLTGTSALNDNSWYFVSVVHNNLANTVQFYVNGVPDGSAQTTTAGFLANNGNLLIGTQNEDGLNSFFNGTIDEVAVWNRALTPTEISGLYDYYS